ncbi:AAA family ATPase, partial [Candidatus Poribacteria bacterium]|nr:AAA family ATPase [Candidatus Poribacteria bacterium]
MRIRTIRLKEYKRFTNLTIEGIPNTAKLIILVGPSGSGKSSLFEAINAWGKEHGSVSYDLEYHKKNGQPAASGSSTPFHNLGVTIEADDSPSNLGEACYMRSAYRHTSKFSVSRVEKIDESEYGRSAGRNFSTSDAEVQKNYQRIYGQIMEKVFDSQVRNNVEIREQVIGQVRDSLQSVFPDLRLHSLEDPEGKGTFYFEKGTAKKYNYVNLSGGEKAAFDLLLDFIIRKEFYPNAAMCIDEPEVHMGLRAQGKLLEVLYDLIPENSQLWLGTHSIGILRASKKILEENPGEVVFLDFSGHDFDQKVEMEPITQPDRELWQKLHQNVLEDLSGLLAPEKIIVCESDPNSAAFDARCYNKIFAKSYPDALFVSAGGKSELNKIIPVLQDVIQKAEIFVVRDRNGLLDERRDELIQEGIRVLNRRSIEDYLIDHEVLDKFADDKGLDACQLRELKDINGNNAKARVGKMYQKIRKEYGLTVGDTKEEFLSDVLARLFSEDMTVYQ